VAATSAKAVKQMAVMKDSVVAYWTAVWPSSCRIVQFLLGEIGVK
jgi:hypothetical protein